MKVETLAALVKIASRISNAGSLTDLFRSIELGPESARCCSEFGNLELAIDPTGLTKEYLLNCSSVSSVSTLPPKDDITFTEKDNKICWTCGDASGTWAIVESDHKIPKIDHVDFPWVPQPGLGDALILAGCACQAQAVSVGLYGINLISDGDNLRLLSSNSISLAQSVVEKGTFPKEKITLRPPVPAIIAGLIAACPGCQLDVTDDGIFIEGAWLKARLPLGTDLDHDLKKLCDKYATTTNVAKINTMAVKRFINRAKLLSDKHTSFTIAFKVEKGRIALAHSGISSSTEEFFMAEGLDPNLSFTSKGFESNTEDSTSIALPADLLIVALAFVDTVVLDYLDKQKLVLKGSNPNFMYIVGGE